MANTLWADALNLVKQSKVNTVSLRYVDAHEKLVDADTSIENLSESSLEDGIKLESGAVVYPNPATAVLNPFVDPPMMRFVCTIQKRPLQSVRVAANQSAEASSLCSPVASIYPLTIAGRPVQELPAGQMDAPMHQEILQGPASSANVARHVPTASAGASGGNEQHMQSSSGMSSYSGGSATDSHRGTSCHQCKNARPLPQLAFCSSLFNKRTSSEMRNCRKKFCQGCLQKFYCDSINNSRVKQGWVCPSCRGICRCAACARKRNKNKQVIGAAFQQVSGAALGVVFDQQLRNLSNLVIPDGQDFVHSNPTFHAMMDPVADSAVTNATSGGDAIAATKESAAEDEIVCSGDASMPKKSESARTSIRKNARSWPYEEQAAGTVGKRSTRRTK